MTRLQDVRACVDLGVDAVGINFWAQSKRGVARDDATALRREVPQSVECVGVFVDTPLRDVVNIAHALRLDAIQVHDDTPVETIATLGCPWVWVIRGTPDLATLRLPSPAPAWVLLDAWVPGFGGRGRTTDWSWAAEAVEYLPWQVWLAGGITPDNVDAALTRVRPAGIDVASGAEAKGASRGEKDFERIRALVCACHGAQ